MEKWRGKVAIVTGASSGIGAVIARVLVNQGMVVVALARREDRLKQLAEEFSKAEKPGKLHIMKADVRKEEDILAVFVWVEKELGGADVLVNNAGVLVAVPIAEGKTEDWRMQLEVNVLAVSICTREYLKSMDKRNNQTGHIFMINSVTGHTTDIAGISMYCSSKHAVKAMSQVLRKELADKSSTIKVTSISPGPVATEIFGHSTSTVISENVKDIPVLQSEDVAAVLVNALSASAVTQICEVVMTPVPTKVALY